MNRPQTIRTAIIDYGLGNLFSVKHACEQAGMVGVITSEKDEIAGADGIILPGVGAFGHAMRSLKELDLIAPIKEFALSGRPLVGICLGMQLLMTESHEFGLHSGLDIVPGVVLPLTGEIAGAGRLKVPHVGWDSVYRVAGTYEPLFDEVPDGDYMYFVHSFYVKPQDSSVVVSTTRFGDLNFCSALRQGQIFACQFHPERSGRQGLKIYENLARIALTTKERTANRV